MDITNCSFELCIGFTECENIHYKQILLHLCSNLFFFPIVSLMDPIVSLMDITDGSSGKLTS